MKIYLLWLSLLAVPRLVLAQSVDDLHQVTVVSGRTAAETAVQTANMLLGKPYVHNTLEGNTPEQLVVNLQAFDCTTFIETTLALALADQDLPASYTPQQLQAAFRSYLTKLRYRNGQINGYASRLHYLSDWLRDNERKGLLQDITREIGGIPVQKAVNYMTTSSWRYPQLTDPAILRQMLLVQTDISQHPFYFIPKKQFRALENRFREGDILMLTAARPGLDMRHVGYATWRAGRLHLLHASSDHHRVVLTQQPLADYLMANKRLSGLRVARVRDTALRLSQQSTPAHPLNAKR